MSRQCPFLEWSSSAGFLGGYECKITNERILTGSAIYENFCNNYENGYSRCPHMKGDNNSSSCFITSACVKAKHLPDDCHELTALRAFRDNWLANQPGGKEAIEEYYAIAPGIVDAICKKTDAQQRFDSLYADFIVPCVALVDAGENEKAYEAYREMVEKLKGEV